LDVGRRTVLRGGPPEDLRDLSGNGRRTLLAECGGYLTPASASLFGGRRSKARGGRDEHLSGREIQEPWTERPLRRAIGGELRERLNLGWGATSTPSGGDVRPRVLTPRGPNPKGASGRRSMATLAGCNGLAGGATP